MRSTTTLYEVTCFECGTETTVLDTHIPATRWDPADGGISPEECSHCGSPFDQQRDHWVELEPPEPEPREDW